MKRFDCRWLKMPRILSAFGERAEELDLPFEDVVLDLKRRGQI